MQGGWDYAEAWVPTGSDTLECVDTYAHENTGDRSSPWPPYRRACTMWLALHAEDSVCPVSLGVCLQRSWRPSDKGRRISSLWPR